MPDENFEQLKAALTEFEYPFIKAMEDSEIRKLFGQENRTKFLLWALSKLELLHEDDECTPKRLENLMIENGLCGKMEAKPFLDSTLNHKRELMIFEAIFYYMESMRVDAVEVVDAEGLHQQFMQLEFTVTKEKRKAAAARKAEVNHQLSGNKAVEADIKKYEDELRNLKCQEAELLSDNSSRNAGLAENFSEVITEFTQMLDKFCATELPKSQMETDEKYQLPISAVKKLQAVNAVVKEEVAILRVLQDDFIKTSVINGFDHKLGVNTKFLEEFLAKSEEIKNLSQKLHK